MTELTYSKQEKEVLGTVANVRYYHMSAPWDAPLSFGVQAFIEYNGLVINDRYQSDLIRVVSITGLDDAEVRDSRQPRPSESGEYAYDSFYGGRVLAITGFIEAGSLPALGILEKNLKAAFAPLVESPLKFRWFDIYDPFDDPNTILEYNANAKLAGIPSGNYSPLIGTLNNLKVENGLLFWNKASKVFFTRVSEKRTFCDVQMTMKCFVGALDSSYIGFYPCAKNSENYILTKYNENSGVPKLEISVIDNNEEHTLESKEITPSLRPSVGQYFWLRGIKEGNELVIQYWNELPTDITFPTFSVSAVMTGEDEENYGNEILSEVGVAGNQINSLWAFDELKIRSLYPGDIKFDARKLSPISIKDEQTSLTKFKRSFQIVMKTSDYRAFSATQITKSIAPTNITNNITLGRKYPRTYPLKYRFFTSTELPLESNLLSVCNKGSVFVEPIIYLYGPGENILIDNLTNSQAMEWLGTINEGDYILFNCREKTIVNSQGIDYLEPLVPTTEWIKLEPMWNDIYVSGTGFGAATKMIVKYRHGTI